MNQEGKARLEWNGRSEAERRTEAAIPCCIQRLHSIGEKGSGNAVVWGASVDAVRFAGEAAGGAKFDFSYVNPMTANVAGKTEAEHFSALLQILVHAGNQMSERGIVAVRPMPSLAAKTAVLMGDVLEGRSVRQASVLRGYDGFTELLAAFPSSSGIVSSHWRWWPKMSEACCPAGGKALFVGLDEAAAGFVESVRLESRGSVAVFVFPLETAVQGCSSYWQNAADAWNFIQEEAGRQVSYFKGIDAYETSFVFDRTAGPQGALK